MFHNSAIIKDTIKIRWNAKYRANGISRDLDIAVIDQLRGEATSIAKFNSMDVEERTENQNEWKNVQNTVRDGSGDIFPAFKRLFGNSVAAKTMDNIIREIALKIDIYNRFVDIT